MKGWVNSLIARGAAFGGLVFGTGAFAASSCGVLPLALSSVGVRSAWHSTELASLADYRVHLRVAAAILVGTAWAIALHRHAKAPSVGARKGGMLSILAILGAATVVIVAATFWRWFSPFLMPEHQ